jgi:outer membrane protein OmpA-like peptidoglycan-associated protein
MTNRRIWMAALAASWLSARYSPVFAQAHTPRFIDLAGAPLDRRQIIDALKLQSRVGATRTRRINLEPMLNAEAGELPVRTAQVQAVEVRSESPRLNFDQITFGFDSSRISPTSMPVLDDIGASLASRELDGLRFLIEGHTDAKGGLQYNMRLSSRRAASVKRYLVTHHHLAPDRLVTAGRGPTDLQDPNRPESGVNRRVVLMSFDGERVAG